MTSGLIPFQQTCNDLYPKLLNGPTMTLATTLSFAIRRIAAPTITPLELRAARPKARGIPATSARPSGATQLRQTAMLEPDRPPRTPQQQPPRTRDRRPRILRHRLIAHYAKNRSLRRRQPLSRGLALTMRAICTASSIGGTQRGFAMTLRCAARRARALGTRLMIVVSVLPRTPLALTSSRCLGWSGRPLRRLILQLFAPLLWSQGGRPEGWPRREARMGPLSMKGITVQELAWICRFLVGDPILLVGVPALPVL